MPPKGGPQVHKRGNKIYLHKGGVKLDKTLPMQQKDRTARGGEVGFDEKSRREFLNGFHKRKVQRQKEAAKKNEKRARQDKIKERSERRMLLKEARGGAATEEGDEEEGGEGAEPQAKRQKVPGAGVQLYGSHIAVSVGGLGDDDEEEEEEDDE